MEDETEVIKQQMAETRESLSEKLEALEQHVVSTVEDTTQSVASAVHSVTDTVEDTVSGVKETVHETVDAVNESVHDTVDSVKHAFDVRDHVERHPWAMLAGAVVVGYIGGRLLTPPRLGSLMPHSLVPDHWERMGDRMARFAAPAEPQPAAPAKPQGPGLLDKLMEQFHPAIDKLKELAINAAAEAVGGMVMQSVTPALRKDVAGVIDQVASAVGGRPLHLEDRPVPEPAPAAARTAPEPSEQQAAPQNRMRNARGNGRRSM